MSHFGKFLLCKVVIEIVVIVIATLIAVVAIVSICVVKEDTDGHARVHLLGAATGWIDVAFFPSFHDFSGSSLEVFGFGVDIIHNLDSISNGEPITGGSISHR